MGLQGVAAAQTVGNRGLFARARPMRGLGLIMAFALATGVHVSGVASADDPEGPALAALQILQAAAAAPQAVDDAYSLQSGTTLTVAAPGVLENDTDPDGDSLTVVPVAGASHGSLTLAPDGMFIYTPVAGFDGADSFEYKAFDGTSQSNTATVSLAVTGGVTTTTTSTTSTTTTTSTTSSTTAAPAIDASTIYTANCAGCHGADGSGGAGPNLITSTMSYDEILNVLSNGAGFMPGYAGSLTADELDALTEFTLALQGPPATTTTTTTTAPPVTTTTTITTTTAAPAIDAAAIYTTNCAGCHGADGSGGAGPNLTTSTMAYDEILNVISVGAGFMPGYAGTLSAAELDALSTFTLDFQGPPATTTTTAPPVTTTTTAATTTTSEPPVPTTTNGSPQSGQQLYGSFCAGCHGADAQGTPLGPDILGEEFWDIVDAIINGQPDMPGFGSALSTEQVDAIADYVVELSWNQSIPTTTGPSATTTAAPPVTTTAPPATTTTAPPVTTTAPPATTTTTTTTTAPAIDAAAIYSANCAGCHGANGEDGAGPSLVTSTMTFAETLDVLNNGAGFMPGYAGSLTPEELDALAAFSVAFQTP